METLACQEKLKVMAEKFKNTGALLGAATAAQTVGAKRLAQMAQDTSGGGKSQKEAQKKAASDTKHIRT